MSQFYFHVHDGRTLLDIEGVSLPDTASALRAAVKLAGRIIETEAHKVARSEEWRMEVADESGLILFRFDFLITHAPASLWRPRQ